MTNKTVLLYEFVTTEEKCGGFFTHDECEEFIKKNKIPDNPEWYVPPSEECPQGIKLSAAMYIPVEVYGNELHRNLRKSESLMRAYTENPLGYVATTVNTEYPDGRMASEEWVKWCVEIVDELLEPVPEWEAKLT